MKMPTIANPQILFRLSCLLVLVILIVFTSCNKSTDKVSDTTKKSEKKIVFKSEDDVKAFIAENLKQPIPSDYKIPSYITSGLPLTQVYDTLKLRYPSFYGKEGQAYLHAVMDDPNTYLKLSLESKSIRRYYDPNSKY